MRPPQWQFLHQGHTYSTKATPNLTRPYLLIVPFSWTRHSNTWIYRSHPYANHQYTEQLFKKQKPTSLQPLLLIFIHSHFHFFKILSLVTMIRCLKNLYFLNISKPIHTAFMYSLFWGPLSLKEVYRKTLTKTSDFSISQRSIWRTSQNIHLIFKALHFLGLLRLNSPAS